MERCSAVASAGLAGLGGLHAIWAAGSSWPLPDAESLSDAVIGHDGFPSPAACLGVAGALAVGSAFVVGLPRQSDRLQRIGATGVVGVLATRGILGLAGRTQLVSPGSSSPRFRRLDRRGYAPLPVPDARGAGSPSGRGGVQPGRGRKLSQARCDDRSDALQSGRGLVRRARLFLGGPDALIEQPGAFGKRALVGGGERSTGEREH